MIDLRLDHRRTPARRPPQAEKSGVMNIACARRATARRLRDALRRRPTSYSGEYLAHQPLTTPVLERIAHEQGTRLVL